MALDREEWISKRAYELWERAERPEGQDEDFWHAASEEWEAGSGQSTSSPATGSFDDEQS